MNKVRVIKSLRSLLMPYPWAIPTIVILGLISSLAEGLGISLLITLLQSLELIDYASDSNFLSDWLEPILISFSAQQRLSIIAFGLFGCVLLKNLILDINTALFSWLNWRIGHRLRSNIFQQLLRINYSFWARYSSGKFVNILAKETWQTNQALAIFAQLIISSCNILILIILLLLIFWQLTIIAAVFTGLISVAIQLITRQNKQIGKQAVQANAVLVSRTIEEIESIRTIRAFGREIYAQNSFERASQQVCSVARQLELFSAQVKSLSEILSTALLICLLLVAYEQLNLPILLTFMLILYRLQYHMKNFDRAWVDLDALTGSLQQVTKLIDPSDKSYIRSGTVPFEGLQRAIALESVSFRYHLDEQPTLQAISFRIPRGQTTAIVGRSGAGKSTLINLLCRFCEVSEGEIYVDDRPLKQLRLADWQRHIGFVSQDTYLFHTTVRENIAYGRLEATETEIIRAARQANAHEFIRRLPQGYNTPVGEKGVRLSRGQRQRIALARAIIRNPEILIFDEVNNALDGVSENLIQGAIDRLRQNRTTIIVDHRLSVIEKADQIVVLSQGRVVEQGTLQYLLQLDRLFARIYRK